MNVAIIGRGRVGNALFTALQPHDKLTVTAMGRRLDRKALRTADLVVVAVSDAAIEHVAERIAPDLQRGAVVVHCAGARGSEPLSACGNRGAKVGVMHPMVSFPSKRAAANLRDKTFVVNGSAQVASATRVLAKACGARVVVADTGNPVYHAAAALSANGAAALAFFSVGWLETLGFTRRDAERVIGGILRSVGENVQTLGVPRALTGPVARGDAHTVDLHRRALRKVGRQALATYDAVLPIVLRTAEAAGLRSKQAAAIRSAVRKRR